MNGAYVGQAVQERPPESLLLEPYPDAPNVGAYFDARIITEQLETEPSDPVSSANILTGYIFHRHPHSLDLSAALAYRYQQASEYMSRFPYGSEQLATSLLQFFTGVEDRLNAGYIAVPTPTIFVGGHPVSPNGEFVAGDHCQRVYLPRIIQERSLAWNAWAQAKIKNGEVDELFTDTVYRHGAKVAAGALLPAGNLWVEVGEGLARVRTYMHQRLAVEDQWGISPGSEVGAGLDYWFIMSHIAEKDLLRLSESIQPGMVDGMKLTPDVYARSYKAIVELIDMNPQLDIKGILSDGSWIYSSELDRLFPDQHISRLHDIAGHVVELGTAEELKLPIQADFATREPTRRAAYEAGDYRVGIAARFIDRKGMLEVLKEYDIEP